MPLMKRTLLFSLGTIVWLGSLVPPVRAQGGPCADDIRQFCPGTLPGSDDFRQCMRSHRDELSDACRDALRQRMGRTSTGASPAAPPETSPSSRGVPFIDTHVHLDGKIPGAGSDFEGAMAKALKRMDALGVTKSLVMPPPMPAHHPNPYDYEDFLSAIRKHPDRFAFLGGGGSLNPMIQEALAAGEATDSLRSKFEKRARKIAADGAVGFGEMTAEHFSFNPRHPYESAPPDHPLFLLLADVAAERGLPIDLHMEAVARDGMPMPKRFQSPPNPRSLNENIAGLERLLAHNRKARVVWVHVGWDNTGDRTVELCRELLKRNPNLYMSVKIDDMSLSQTSPLDHGRLRPEWLELIKEFPDRFVIGSDSFYSSPRFPFPRPTRGEDLRVFLDKLPPDLARKIAVDNVLSLYPPRDP